MNLRGTINLVVAGVALSGLLASLAIRHHADARIREKDASLWEQDDQLAEFEAERERLCTLLAQANNSTNTSLAADRIQELMKLGTEAEALQKQADDLGKELARGRRSEASQIASIPDTGPSSSSSVARYVVSDSSSEEYKVQLYKIASAAPHSFPLTNGRTIKDVRNLGSAVGKYAREHQGEFPSSFDQAVPYFYQDEETPRSSEFEMTFQGSLNELSNIPLQAVALIRERHAWPTQSGKWARVYLMASGFVRVVESDDSFQSWEAEHLIPAPNAR